MLCIKVYQMHAYVLKGAEIMAKVKSESGRRCMIPTKVSEAVKERLIELAEAKDITVSSLINELVMEYIENN